MSEIRTQSQDSITRTLGLDEGGGGPRRRKRWILWGTALLVVVLFAMFHAHRMGKDSLPQYETQRVSRGDLAVHVSATGTLQPVNEVDVGTEVSGTIKTVEADYNDRVTVGQVLVRLDASKLEAQALQCEASLEAARARLLQAQATVKEAEAKSARLKQLRELSGGKMPSSNDLDVADAILGRARADEASARASIAQTQASLDVARTDLGKAVICSPINGVVLTRDVEPGQTVAASLQAPVLFTLAEDLSQLELQVDVDEADVGQVHAGLEATFNVDAYPEQTFPAQITQVRFGPQTVEGVVTYKTILAVDNSKAILRPGMTATAVIAVKKVRDVLLVPNAAFRFSPPETQPASKSEGGLVSAILPHPPRPEAKSNAEAGAKGKEQRVWTLQNGQLSPITITKGVSDGVFTEVVAGDLKEGTELVIDTATQSS